MTRGVVSDRHPAHAVILSRAKDAKRDVWLITGSGFWRTFPCACHLGKACVTTGDFPCWCSGRLDPDLSVSHCCAARAARLASRKDTQA